MYRSTDSGACSSGSSGLTGELANLLIESEGIKVEHELALTFLIFWLKYC